MRLKSPPRHRARQVRNRSSKSAASGSAALATIENPFEFSFRTEDGKFFDCIVDSETLLQLWLAALPPPPSHTMQGCAARLLALARTSPSPPPPRPRHALASPSHTKRHAHPRHSYHLVGARAVSPHVTRIGPRPRTGGWSSATTPSVA